MTASLVSVIIPTFNRPKFLPRAVKSALDSAPDGDTEVIVVPNGSDESWKESLAPWENDKRVRISPITTPHANAARNHGMELATGKYLRFLDDDDYLYPDVCKEQYTELDKHRADICSSDVDIVRLSGKLEHTYAQPDTDDFVESVLTPSRMSATCAHLYRRECLKEARWDEGRSIRQDTAWLIQLATSKEMSWHRYPKSVAAYVQHSNQRISRGHDPGPSALKETAELIQSAYAQLESLNRLTPVRARAAADALWSSLQKGLRYDPWYWLDIARIAESYYPGRRPPSRIHRLPLARDIDPLFIEACLIPIRWAYAPIRKMLDKLVINRA